MQKSLAVFTLTAVLFSTSVYACKSDADCALDQICNDAGQCVADGRDWNDLKKALLDFSRSSSSSIENVTPVPAKSLSTQALQLMPQGQVFDKVETALPLTSVAATNYDLRACGMSWHRDEQRPAGLYSVWRPSRPVYIVVNMTRKGKFVGSIDFSIRPPNQEISLLINQNGQDHDGVRSCVVTL